MKDFYGDVFALINKAEEYTLEHINIGIRLEGLLRVDVPEIDREAFREAIVNAFCHRDYREYDSVNIAIFKDWVKQMRWNIVATRFATVDTKKAPAISRRCLIFKWCPGTESNRRHEDFQSSALPTELPGQKDFSYNPLWFNLSTVKLPFCYFAGSRFILIGT